MWRLRAAATEESSVEEEQAEDWSMYLDLNPGFVKIADANAFPEVIPKRHKAEVVYTRNIESILANLTGPLDVTYIVSPEEVMANLEAWRPAIVKEVKGVEIAIERLLPGTEARETWFNTPRVQRLPMKLVFTIKPNSGAVSTDPSTWLT